MKKYITTLIFTLFLGLTIMILGVNNVKAASNIDIDSSLNYGTSYNYKLTSSMNFDKYTIEYILYSKDSNQYYYAIDEYNSAVSSNQFCGNLLHSIEK